MNNGIFISIEGPDGSGKSTQIQYLRKYFDDKGIDILFTREPGGTQIGEKIRQIILDKNNTEMSSMAEALLYAASRAQHVSQFIKPAIDRGAVVICDRYIDSSIAYQGYGRELGDCVRIINEYAVEGCMPDITFLMCIDPKIGKDRISIDKQDRLDREKIEFHQRVYNGYMQLAEKYSNRYIVIDAANDKETVKEDIYRHLDRILKGRV